jgi:hypothetical protein
MDLIKGATRPEDRRRFQDGCKTIRKRWLEVEEFARRKPHIIQKAVSAQLQLYRDDLKKQDEEERKITAKAEHEKNEKLRLERKESSEAPATSLGNF